MNATHVASRERMVGPLMFCLGWKLKHTCTTSVCFVRATVVRSSYYRSCDLFCEKPVLRLISYSFRRSAVYPYLGTGHHARHRKH